MPSLLSLPTEILQNIIAQVNPDDLASFCVCCKELNEAAVLHLDKHRKRIETYSELRYSGCFRHGDDDHPVQLLREICLDGQIAFYPRTLYITCCEVPDDMDAPNYEMSLSDEDLLAKRLDDEKFQKVFDDVRSIIIERLSKKLGHNAKNMYIWRQRFERGTRGAVLCLLLLLLPNLERLHLTHSEFESRILRDMLDLIAADSQRSHEASGFFALSKLSKVFLEGSEDDGDRCHILSPLAALPSLRSIVAESVIGDPTEGRFYEELQWPYDQHISRVTSLSLQFSRLRVTSFSRLLGGLRRLKSFEYDCYRRRERDDVQVLDIVGILLEHAQASLKSVAFTGLRDWHCFGDHNLRLFKEFAVLKETRMHSAYYLKDGKDYEWNNDGESFRDWYDDIDRLVDLLPRSIKSVTMDGSVDIDDISSLLKDLPQRKAICVPFLKCIDFVDYTSKDHDNLSRDWEVTLRDNCRKVGVKLLL